MTAYIKMVDVWMIFTMMYPFCVVTLYSVMEALKNKKTNTKTVDPDFLYTRDLMNERSMRAVAFLLDWGLPILVTVFIIFFWSLGITNYVSSQLDNVC